MKFSFLSVMLLLATVSSSATANIVISDFSHTAITVDVTTSPLAPAVTALTNDVTGVVLADSRFSNGTGTVGGGEFSYNLPESNLTNFAFDGVRFEWNFDAIDVSTGFDSLEFSGIFDTVSGSAPPQLTVFGANSTFNPDGTGTNIYQITTTNLPSSVSITDMAAAGLGTTQVTGIRIDLLNQSGFSGAGTPATASSSAPSIYFQATAVPDPSSALFLMGAFGLVALRRRVLLQQELEF